MQGFLPVTNQTNMQDLHNGIICGAAQFINEIELFDNSNLKAVSSNKIIRKVLSLFITPIF